MDFKKLYADSKKQIAEAIMSMWQDAVPKMVDMYKDQLDTIIDTTYRGDNIVVENMSHWEPADNEDWRQIVSPKIWRKYDIDQDGNRNIVDIKYPPYKHQFTSWDALLRRDKSIVVTSGTGSGKTECFMVPLIHHLTSDNKNYVQGQGIEAIFLYPLNALMEDQKERINNYITFSEKKLTFAVYNGNTPENEQDQRYDGDSAMENEILTRNEIRYNHPNILFTNPSMLEYMLLRAKDKSLFGENLKWIVIDETHTYKGAAGAELAMLIRRILKACGKNVNDIKFATSSATIGNSEDAEDELRQFICDITGQNKDKIEIVKGFRTKPNTKDSVIRRKLEENNYILLKNLIPDDNDIESRLEKINKLSDDGLRIRMHYYLQALNGGLYVNPNALKDNGNKFVLYKDIPLLNGKLDPHYLEAYYCKKCGSLVGYGQLETDDNTSKYSFKTRDISSSFEDMFVSGNNDDSSDDIVDAGIDIVDEKKSSSKLRDFYVGIAEDGTQGSLRKLAETGDCFLDSPSGIFGFSRVEENKTGEKGKEKIVQVHRCPICDAYGSGKNNPMRPFRMSTDSIGRLIAPILLDQTTKAKMDDGTLPREGRKYITFADSRQSVAGPSLKQNLETEVVWVTGVLYNELKKYKQDEVNCRRFQELLDKSKSKNLSKEETDEFMGLVQAGYYAGKTPIEYITWNDAIDILLNDNNCEGMYLAFAKRNEPKSDLAKAKYVASAIYRALRSRYGVGRNSPENCGLLCTIYPDIRKLIDRPLPESIKKFNKLIQNQELHIQSKDWYDFVKLFIDLKIRGDESLFFCRKQDGGKWDEIDIEDCRSYKTELSSRRPINADTKKVFGHNTRFTKLLINLLGKTSWSELDIEERECVQEVAETQLVEDLKWCNIMEQSMDKNIDRQTRLQNGWRRSQDYYMNLSRIAFKLYDTVWFDSNSGVPLDTTFKSYSPYRGDNGGYNVLCKKIDWAIFDGKSSAKEWFNDKLKVISHRWTSKLGRILDYSSKNPNNLYIQAEHTAQVARSIIKDKTQMFIDGKINIMSCSTTMEMGVDLGDLELVVMNNVPPHPANYKQRAGRAGRGDQNKSACVTICGADTIGESVMNNPLESLILYKVQPPKVDMSSDQLIQRHINSFLLRKFIEDNIENFNPGIDSENGFQLCKMFSNYYVENKRVRSGQTDVYPGDYVSILDQENTLYKNFLANLNNWATETEMLSVVGDLTNATNTNTLATNLINKTKEQIEDVAKYIDQRLLNIKNEWAHNNLTIDSGYGRRLNYEFTSLLSKNLLGFLSTHQFTPNANMPVGVVEMLLEDNGYGRKENPSRDMKVALAEYAPGKMVFNNGETYLMRGVKWDKIGGALQTVKYCANHHVWMTGEAQCPKCNSASEQWKNFGNGMEVLTPTGFIPYKDTSRITIKDEQRTSVDIELVNVGDWQENAGFRLYSVRVNDNGPGSEILYYNKGLGQGYYVCKHCGYAVPVPNEIQGISENERILKSIYPSERRTRNTGKLILYHDYNDSECQYNGTRNFDLVLKNVVLGGTIQTDYCEIALATPQNGEAPNEEVARTLGVMLCKELSRKIGCERGDIDFIPRIQNGYRSVCIFDTAKGGAGYSNRLKDKHLLETIFDNVREQLNNCKSIRDILDRTTMQYASSIDITKTNAWLQAEYSYRGVVPEDIQQKFGNRKVRASNYDEIQQAVQNISLGEFCMLFFNGSNIADWNFNEGEVNWKENRSKYLCDNKKLFAAYGAPAQISSRENEKMKLASSGELWKKIENNYDDIYPIAQVGTVLYFTTKKEYTGLNEKWALEDIWSVDNTTKINFEDMNVVVVGDEHYSYKKETSTRSDAIFEELYNNSSKLRDYISTVKGKRLHFKYHEEFLRTHLGMTMTMQFILALAEKANASIENIAIIGEKYDDSHLEEKKPKNYDIETGYPVSLIANCLNDRQRDEYIEQCFLKPLFDNEIIVSYEDPISLCKNDLPHWRALVVKDLDTGALISVLPNGGFANGWRVNTQQAREEGKRYSLSGDNHFNHQYTDVICDVHTSIPIINEDSDVLYDIKVGEELW